MNTDETMSEDLLPPGMTGGDSAKEKTKAEKEKEKEKAAKEKEKEKAAAAKEKAKAEKEKEKAKAKAEKEKEKAAKAKEKEKAKAEKEKAKAAKAKEEAKAFGGEILPRGTKVKYLGTSKASWLKKGTEGEIKALHGSKEHPRYGIKFGDRSTVLGAKHVEKA